MILQTRAMIVVGIVLVSLVPTLAAQSPKRIVSEFKRGNLAFVARHSDTLLIIDVGGPADTLRTNDTRVRRELLERIWKGVSKAEIAKGTIIGTSNSCFLIQMPSFNSDGELESDSSFVFEFVLHRKRYKLRSISLAG